MQDFNQHTHTMGWADTLLMSLYKHSIKEKIHLAMVISNIEFDSFRSMQVMVLKVCQTIEGIRQDLPTPNLVPTVPAPPPANLMQWNSPHSRRPQATNSPTPSEPVRLHHHEA
ncbi:uncharacterized protein VP01_713g8 [Puccinia sorghi]|uniref:Uncharacterized protein n=1 Tax=Puccinia sorghi TaxID=27349 RepID=A0A0L6UEA9_9BASI|nr:uncharacterized protein VP01_713g8 [Puccinia sorghi]